MAYILNLLVAGVMGNVQQGLQKGYCSSVFPRKPGQCDPDECFAFCVKKLKKGKGRCAENGPCLCYHPCA